MKRAPLKINDNQRLRKIEEAVKTLNDQKIGQNSFGSIFLTKLNLYLKNMEKEDRILLFQKLFEGSSKSNIFLFIDNFSKKVLFSSAFDVNLREGSLSYFLDFLSFIFHQLNRDLAEIQGDIVERLDGIFTPSFSEKKEFFEMCANRLKEEAEKKKEVNHPLWQLIQRCYDIEPDISTQQKMREAVSVLSINSQEAFIKMERLIENGGSGVGSAVCTFLQEYCKRNLYQKGDAERLFQKLVESNSKKSGYYIISFINEIMQKGDFLFNNCSILSDLFSVIILYQGEKKWTYKEGILLLTKGMANLFSRFGGGTSPREEIKSILTYLVDLCTHSSKNKGNLSPSSHLPSFEELADAFGKNIVNLYENGVFFGMKDLEAQLFYQTSYHRSKEYTAVSGSKPYAGPAQPSAYVAQPFVQQNPTKSLTQLAPSAQKLIQLSGPQNFSVQNSLFQTKNGGLGVYQIKDGLPQSTNAIEEGVKLLNSPEIRNNFNNYKKYFIAISSILPEGDVSLFFEKFFTESSKGDILRLLEDYLRDFKNGSNISSESESFFLHLISFTFKKINSTFLYLNPKIKEFCEEIFYTLFSQENILFKKCFDLLETEVNTSGNQTNPLWGIISQYYPLTPEIRAMRESWESLIKNGEEKRALSVIKNQIQKDEKKGALSAIIFLQKIQKIKKNDQALINEVIEEVVRSTAGQKEGGGEGCLKDFINILSEQPWFFFENYKIFSYLAKTIGQFKDRKVIGSHYKKAVLFLFEKWADELSRLKKNDPRRIKMEKGLSHLISAFYGSGAVPSIPSLEECGRALGKNIVPLYEDGQIFSRINFDSPDGYALNFFKNLYQRMLEKPFSSGRLPSYTPSVQFQSQQPSSKSAQSFTQSSSISIPSSLKSSQTSNNSNQTSHNFTSKTSRPPFSSSQGTSSWGQSSNMSSSLKSEPSVVQKTPPLLVKPPVLSVADRSARAEGGIIERGGAKESSQSVYDIRRTNEKIEVFFNKGNHEGFINFVRETSGDLLGFEWSEVNRKSYVAFFSEVFKRMASRGLLSDGSLFDRMIRCLSFSGVDFLTFFSPLLSEKSDLQNLQDHEKRYLFFKNVLNFCFTHEKAIQYIWFYSKYQEHEKGEKKENHKKLLNDVGGSLGEAIAADVKSNPSSEEVAILKVNEIFNILETLGEDPHLSVVIREPKIEVLASLMTALARLGFDQFPKEMASLLSERTKALLDKMKKQNNSAENFGENILDPQKMLSDQVKQGLDSFGDASKKGYEGYLTFMKKDPSAFSQKPVVQKVIPSADIATLRINAARTNVEKTNAARVSQAIVSHDKGGSAASAASGFQSQPQSKIQSQRPPFSSSQGTSSWDQSSNMSSSLKSAPLIVRNAPPLLVKPPAQSLVDRSTKTAEKIIERRGAMASRRSGYDVGRANKKIEDFINRSDHEGFIDFVGGISGDLLGFEWRDNRKAYAAFFSEVFKRMASRGLLSDDFLFDRMIRCLYFSGVDFLTFFSSLLSEKGNFQNLRDHKKQYLFFKNVLDFCFTHQEAIQYIWFYSKYQEHEKGEKKENHKKLLNDVGGSLGEIIAAEVKSNPSSEEVAISKVNEIFNILEKSKKSEEKIVSRESKIEVLASLMTALARLGFAQLPEEMASLLLERTKGLLSEMTRQNDDAEAFGENILDPQKMLSDRVKQRLYSFGDASKNQKGYEGYLTFMKKDPSAFSQKPVVQKVAPLPYGRRNLFPAFQATSFSSAAKEPTLPSGRSAPSANITTLRTNAVSGSQATVSHDKGSSASPASFVQPKSFSKISVLQKKQPILSIREERENDEYSKKSQENQYMKSTENVIIRQKVDKLLKSDLQDPAQAPFLINVLFDLSQNKDLKMEKFSNMQTMSVEQWQGLYSSFGECCAAYFLKSFKEGKVDSSALLDQVKGILTKSYPHSKDMEILDKHKVGTMASSFLSGIFSDVNFCKNKNNLLYRKLLALLDSLDKVFNEAFLTDVLNKLTNKVKGFSDSDQKICIGRFLRSLLVLPDGEKRSEAIEAKNQTAQKLRAKRHIDTIDREVKPSLSRSSKFVDSSRLVRSDKLKKRDAVLLTVPRERKVDMNLAAFKKFLDRYAYRIGLMDVNVFVDLQTFLPEKEKESLKSCLERFKAGGDIFEKDNLWWRNNGHLNSWRDTVDSVFNSPTLTFEMMERQENFSIMFDPRGDRYTSF